MDHAFQTLGWAGHLARQPSLTFGGIGLSAPMLLDCDITLLKNNGHFSALADVAQWIEQRVAGSIHSQDTCLGCRPGPQWGPHERQPHTDVFLPLFLSPFPSLKINK